MATTWKGVDASKTRANGSGVEVETSSHPRSVSGDAVGVASSLGAELADGLALSPWRTQAVQATKATGRNKRMDRRLPSSSLSEVVGATGAKRSSDLMHLFGK
jgi:hypothetical protein